MKSSSKRWIRRFSRSLHNKGLNITFSNDNNAIVFLDNDLESTRENWNQIETQTGESRLPVLICIFSCPDLLGTLWNGGQVKPSWFAPPHRP